MKKTIFVLLAIALVIGFTVSAMAQSGQENINASEPVTGETSRNPAAVDCPFAPDGGTGCCLQGYDGPATGSSHPGSCCRVSPSGSASESTQNAAAASSQVQRGCCVR